MNRKVGIYLRLSNEDRDKINREDDSESIKNQRNMLIDYINKHDDLVLIDEYCDSALSGAGTYRPEFERLIRGILSKKVYSNNTKLKRSYINGQS